MSEPNPLEKWPELGTYAEGVRRVYGDRLKDLWLFGSRARGDHRSDSDFDVAVVLKKRNGTRFDEVKNIGRISHPLRFEKGVFIHSLPVTSKEFDNDETPIMRKIKTDGVRLLDANT